MTMLSTCTRCGRAILVVAAVGLAAPHDMCRPDPSGVYCMQPAREQPHTHRNSPSNQRPARTVIVASTSSTSGSLNLGDIVRPGSP
jgi:hypothetical protein